MSWQTTIRQQLLEPLLPPPAVAFVRDTADPLFAEWGLGTEGTVTLLTTLLAAYLTYTVLKLVLLSISSSNSSSGAVSAIVDDNDTAQQQRQLQQQRRYHSTVVLCGPAHAGKTRLFYQLCYPNTSKSKQPVLTLTSLQPNVGVNKDNGVRYIDLPGHSMGNNNNSTTTALLNRAFAETKKKPLRLILTLDATQPVASAAAILYQLWDLAATANASKNNNKNKTTITIACHKQDLVKAKNGRRIAIQLRTALEQLLSVRKPAWWYGNSGRELESLLTTELPHIELQWVATSCESHTGKNPNEMDKLQRYCETGEWKDSSSDAAVPTAQSK